MSEQVTKSQTEEVAPVDTSVQPAKAVEEQHDGAAPETTTKVVDSEKPSGKAEEAPVESEEKPADEKAAEVEQKEATHDEEKVTEEKPSEAVAEDKAEPTDKVAEPEKVEETATNGDHKSKETGDQVSEAPVVEETNGVSKRKDNGSEAVEDEKSPKKAKVVDEADQKPVEETAA